VLEKAELIVKRVAGQRKQMGGSQGSGGGGSSGLTSDQETRLRAQVADLQVRGGGRGVVCGVGVRSVV
jgi:hypothetical protein